jgi:hypothetical protein
LFAVRPPPRRLPLVPVTIRLSSGRTAPNLPLMVLAAALLVFQAEVMSTPA